MVKPRLKTPISYYGGKQTMLPHILPLIPRHTLYTEAFCGGCAVLFAKEPSPCEIINDTNKELVNFYRVAQTEYDALKREVDASLHSRDQHTHAKHIMTHPQFFTSVQRAWAVWIGSKLGFASMLDGTFGYDRSGTTNLKLFNARDNFTEMLCQRLSHVTIESEDGKNVIQRYDSPEAFHFVDPPYEVVRRELFSKANCPAVTLKYGSVAFNVRAIRKLDECSHVQILINAEKKLMIAKPCGEEEKDSVQWSKVDKREKTVTRLITGKYFTAQLFEEMNWDINSTIKILGTLLKCKDEKIFVFNLVNAEAYISVSAMDPDDPKRRKRIPLMPVHWQGHYGQSYEESKVEVVKTFEGVPEGFVKITLPQAPAKKQAADKSELNEITNQDTVNGTV